MSETKKYTGRDLYEETKRSQELGYVTDRLGMMFMWIANRTAYRSNFTLYSWKDDMIMYGFHKIFESEIWRNIKLEDNIKMEDGTIGHTNVFGMYFNMISDSFREYCTIAAKKRRDNTAYDRAMRGI